MGSVTLPFSLFGFCPGEIFRYYFTFIRLFLFQTRQFLLFSDVLLLHIRPMVENYSVKGHRKANKTPHMSRLTFRLHVT